MVSAGRTRLAITALLAAVLCAAAATPGVAKAPETLSASAGGISATLTTDPQLFLGSNLAQKLTITDSGSTVFSGSLGFRCRDCAPFSPGHGASPLQVMRLSPVGPDEVLVFLAEAGGYETTLAVYHRVAAGTYVPAVVRSIDVSGAQIVWRATTVDVGGTVLLQGDDLRFLRLNEGSEFFAALPRLLWRFDPSTNSGLVNVTDHYPALLRAEAARALRDAERDQQLRPQNDGDNDADPRGALAVYAEAETELGDRAQAERELQSALAEGWLNESSGPTGSTFVARVEKLLGTPPTAG